MDVVKRVHVIACGVLAVDLKAEAETLGLDLSMQFLPGGLHRSPRELRLRLQEAIDAAAAAQRGDLIAIGYGVCGLGTVGVHARNVPLAIPRVNDCIALFLGSDAAYKEQFARYPGTYYISAGWIEEKALPESMSRETAEPRDPTAVDYDRLVRKLGRENAEAIRYFLSSWQRNYQRAAFIDTGAVGRRKYADIARAMAEEFGWKYEELTGSGTLLRKLLTQRSTTDDILIVPPHHATAYDAVTRGLAAVPVWENDSVRVGGTQTLVFGGERDAPSRDGERTVRVGLGIDAGGTYTDVVLYDFQRSQVLQKAKALTTRWDFTVGIEEALDQLDANRLEQVDLVSLSTTLATNAIVEGRGQKVGLLIMPPYGLFDPSDIAHRPIAVLDGRLEIDGRELAPIDRGQVRRVVQDMIAREQVGAFAVAGYASHNNPAHELQVKAIVEEQTSLAVTCGHDVSEGLNYRIRAQTAALNARIIPCLVSLIDEVQTCLMRRGIRAPRMVVKSDGSLMSAQAARRRPIETILSGPAASVAGASFLSKRTDAIVVDMGGTTTDTAVIRNGVVQACQEGASVGGWRTHVRALDLRTLGLGGDSLIAYQKRHLSIGPRRVAPVAWLMARHRDGAEALDWLDRHIDHFDVSTRGMDLMALNGHDLSIPLSNEETRIVELLRERPRSVHELAHRTKSIAWQFLPLARMEEASIVQRCGLTPTDLLHATGQIALWDIEAARRACGLFSRLLGVDPDAFAERVIQQAVRNLAIELLKKQLDGQVDPDEIDSSPAAAALVNNWLDGGSTGYRVHVALKTPIVGLGAPVHYFVPKAAELLGTEAVIPPHADVANAIGAITSSVVVRRQVRIAPDENGRYRVNGLPDTPAFVNFEQAHEHAVEQLQRIVRKMAREAGTSEATVEIDVRDGIAALSDGSPIFVGRTLRAQLSGVPDIIRLAADR